MSKFFYLFLILLVVFRFYSTRPVYKDGDLVKVTGRISSQPTVYDNYRSIVLEGLRVNIPKYPEVDYGDTLEIVGMVSGERLISSKIQKIIKSESKLVLLRSKITNFYNKYLPVDHAALVSGVVLGDKSSITDTFREKLVKTGVVHVVVASGMNVTFVASFLLAILLLVIKRPVAIPFVIVGILIYIALSGFDAPIVRAGIMGFVAFFAQETGRLSTASRALALSAILMLIVNPLWVFDLGFILSFVATASLLIFQKRIEKRITHLPGIFKEGLSTSLAAQIGVAPIIFVTFGRFNILSPVVNALVLWTIPLIMVFGAIGGLIGLVFPALGGLILYLTYPLTWFFINTIEFFY